MTQEKRPSAQDAAVSRAHDEHAEGLSEEDDGRVRAMRKCPTGGMRNQNRKKTLVTNIHYGMA